MKIQGLQKLTLLDYPEKIAATVFLGGCNFRCPFCHNASLVLGHGGEDISRGELLAFLSSRIGKLGGVCITGGEPTLHPDLPELIESIKALGFCVKLDTNGTNPGMLQSLIARRLVDYVAMDIKSSPAGYARAAGVPGLDLAPIRESVQILLNADIDYEFRTTVVRELHTAEDFCAIGEWIRGAKKYFLQSFEDSGDLIKDGFSSYSKAEITTFLNLILHYVPNAQIRG